jgi:hypothetical protein
MSQAPSEEEAAQPQEVSPEDGAKVTGDGSEPAPDDEITTVTPESQDLEDVSDDSEGTPEENGIEESVPEASISEEAPKPKVSPASPEDVIATLKELREDVGQIYEISSEEENIVIAFSLAFLKLMESLTRSLPVDVETLQGQLRNSERANILPKGELVVLFRDGRMESVDLLKPENRDLLVDVVSDVMPKFNDLIGERRGRIEKRISFLADVTKELQNIADSVTAVS